MALESFVPDNKFGITSSNVVLLEDMDNFLSGKEPEITTIPKKKEEKPIDDNLKTEDKKVIEPPKKVEPLTDKDLLGLKEEGEEENGEDGDEQSTEEVIEENANVFADLAEDMYDIGIFTDDEGEEREPILTAEQFKNRFEIEKRKGVEEVLESFLNDKGEEARQTFQALLVDGVDPRTFVEKYASVKDFEGLDITLEDNQVKVLRELYKREKKKDIEAKIEKLKTYGDLADEAKEALEIIVAADKEALENEKTLARNRELSRTQIKQEFFNNVNRVLSDKLAKKEFDGIPVTKEFAQEVGNYITRDVYKNSKGEFLTAFDNDILSLNKPENHELKIKIAMLYKLIQKDPTLTTIQKSGVSKESSILFKKTQRSVNRTEGEKEKSKEIAQPKSWF